jgi:predicted Zn-dependent protease
MLERLSVVLLAMVIALSTVGCATDSAVVSQAAGYHRDLEATVIRDPQLQQYVQTLGDRVVAAARQLHQDGFLADRLNTEDPSWMFQNIQFHLVGSEVLNAFTTGGQHVYLYTELFKSSKTEDEFAAVVAHEFAHIFARHVHNTMNRNYAMTGLALAGMGAGYALGEDGNREQMAQLLGGSAALVGQAVGSGYSRRDEDEADAIGFEFYVRAGWDPDQFGGFFQTMIDRGYESNDPMASHPRLSDRVRNARQRSAAWKSSNPQWQALRQQNTASPELFAQLQQRADAAARAMPRDNPRVAAAELLFDAFPSCVAPTQQKRQVEARREITRLTGTQEQR